MDESCSVSTSSDTVVDTTTTNKSNLPDANDRLIATYLEHIQEFVQYYQDAQITNPKREESLVALDTLVTFLCSLFTSLTCTDWEDRFFQWKYAIEACTPSLPACIEAMHFPEKDNTDERKRMALQDRYATCNYCISLLQLLLRTTITYRLRPTILLKEDKRAEALEDVLPFYIQELEKSTTLHPDLSRKETKNGFTITTTEKHKNVE